MSASFAPRLTLDSADRDRDGPSSSSVTVADEFGAPDFDIKRFINQQLESSMTTPTNSSGDSTFDLSASSTHLSSLLMKLQLLAADINSTLETQSQELVQAMPKAMRDLSLIHRESQSVRVNLSDILKDMSTIEHSKPSATAVAVTGGAGTGGTITTNTNGVGTTNTNTTAMRTTNNSNGKEASSNASTAASTIDFLQAIDVVNSRILRCTSTLEELDRWSKRERLVDSLLVRLPVASDGTAAAAVASPAGDSLYADLARAHTEIEHMKQIVNKFTTLGVAPSEATSRQANLEGFSARRDQVAKLLLDQTMAALAASEQQEHEETPSTQAASSTASSSSSLLSHLRILRRVYASDVDTFETAYATGKLRQQVQRILRTTSSINDESKVKQIERVLKEIITMVHKELEFGRRAFDDGKEEENSKDVETHSNGSNATIVPSSSSSMSSDPTASSVDLSSSFLLSSLLGVLHSELSPWLAMTLSSHLSQVRGSDHTTEVGRVWKVITAGFGCDLMHIVDTESASSASSSSSSDASHVRSSRRSIVEELLLSPFLRFFQEWTSLEKKSLFASLDHMSFGGDTYEVLSHNIVDLHRMMLNTSSNAIVRCQGFCGGILIEGVIEAIGEYYTEVVQRLFSLMRRLRRMAGLDGINTPTATTTPTTAQAKKSPTGGRDDTPGPSTSPTGVDGSQLSGASSFASFQGAFTLLRVCRSLQWDLFAAHAEENLLTKSCGHGLVTIVRNAMHEEEKKGENELATPPPAHTTTTHVNTKTTLPTKSVMTTHPHPAIHPTPIEIEKLLAQVYLVQHGDRLKSLVEFLSNHYPPFNTVSNDAPHGTQGLHAHAHGHVVHTPHAHASVGGVASPGGGTGVIGSTSTRGKYGFTNTPNAGGSSSSSSSHLFSSSSTLFDSFISAVHNLILDTMFKPIGTKLSTFHEWSMIWVGKTQSTGGILSSIPLPTFSLQPSEYMIQIGEHLLTLVQQMEPFVTKNDDDDDDGAGAGGVAGTVVDGSLGLSSLNRSTSLTDSPSQPTYIEHDALYWLNLLSKGTFKHLQSSIHQLTSLSEGGARQLACDIEYLVNVLAALGVNIPTTILKLQVWLTSSETHLLQQLKEDRIGEEWRLEELTSEERRMLKQFIRVRGFKQIESNAQLQAKINQ